MTADQIQQAADAAIRAMCPKARAAFVAMYEANDARTSDVAQAYAVEGIHRQMHLATLALENSRIMAGLVDAVEAQLA